VCPTFTISIPAALRRPQDWPWSSYLSYEKGEMGLLPIDFV
jgi:hypothetical protein